VDHKTVTIDEFINTILENQYRQINLMLDFVAAVDKEVDTHALLKKLKRNEFYELVKDAREHELEKSVSYRLHDEPKGIQ